ncbi:DUF6155 family protein [Flavobacterium sedimenticola]|uniref:DUF6155 family protein n=1 Tax=Flavobacterium sedimenticola TaxID=3043286 RepID=A0ABT6XTA0_9FLAO|nr:DUF6155 family protein [Flavobacterium sedimenticola]MDI9258327.1 DUF6155 family protein [Flavobacterium sedimenticola]
MSKRDLKKYLGTLSKAQLETQIVELYDKFSNVKTFYDFAFNPNEDKLLREAKVKISNEYFPTTNKRAKMRRSVAQKFIKHFITIGVDPYITADVMLYTLEIALAYSSEKTIKPASFYSSMLSSFSQVIRFCVENGMVADFKNRIISVNEKVQTQQWPNRYDFTTVIEKGLY